MNTSTKIEQFTKNEQELIDKAAEKLKDQRLYSDRPRFYHDMILKGCQSTLDRKAK